MKKPTRGTFQNHQDGVWYLHQGHVKNHSPIPLPNLHQDIIFLIELSQLTRGHWLFHKIHNNQHQKIFQNAVAYHVSLRIFKHTDTPTLIKMNTMDPSDKKFLKAAYDEEYDILQNLPAWNPILEFE